jgi:hypothetical protein
METRHACLNVYNCLHMTNVQVSTHVSFRNLSCFSKSSTLKNCGNKCSEDETAVLLQHPIYHSLEIGQVGEEISSRHHRSPEPTS